MEGRLTFQELPKHCCSGILRVGNNVGRAWSNLLREWTDGNAGSQAPWGIQLARTLSINEKGNPNLSVGQDLEPTAVPRINPLISGF